MRIIPVISRAEAAAIPCDARRALEEDLADIGDITSDTLFDRQRSGRARLLARESMVLCGLAWAEEVFRQFDPEVRFSSQAADGDSLIDGDVAVILEGRLRSLLAGERTALNFLMRMSGVASVTAAAVREVAGTGCIILDTRKTLPGWRLRDKYAVRTGGAANHRMGLYDAAMIKDTHLAAIGDLAEAVRRLRDHGIAADRITAEVRTTEQLESAIAAGAGRALLDNMDLDLLAACVRRGKGRIVLEASGGLRPGSLRNVADTGVDCMSLGWLTHSAPAADLSMEMDC